MTELDYKLNLELMQELGLEEGNRQRVIDQDDGEICALGTREIIMPKSQSTKAEVEFDGINNPRMMSVLFGQFVDKLAEEGETECIAYGSHENKSGRLTVTAKFMDGSEVKSKPYRCEGLCYMDVIKQINGDIDVDLNEFDVDRGDHHAKKKKTNTNKKKWHN